MDGFRRDIRFAVLGLLRAPTFTVVAVATLAIGIGANTAIFSLVNGVLLRDLPYDSPDQLVTVWLDMTRRDGPEREWFTPADYAEYRAEPNLFEEIGAWGGVSPTLTGLGEPRVLNAAVVTEGLLTRVLRAKPVLGREFLPGEDIPDGPGVVVLSHGFWQQHFGGDRSVLGRSLSLNEQPAVIVGVMPEDFRPPFVPDAQLWAPIRLDPARCGFGCYTIRTVARLAEGVSLDGARQRAGMVAARLEEAHPEANARIGVSVYGLQDDLVRTAARGLWVLLGAVGFVLLIACTNVANLLLARGAAREGEFAVRVALGAGRAPILRQLLTESLVLSAIGGVLGLAVAVWGTGLLLAMLPPTSLPALSTVGVDGRVLVFTGAVTFTAGLLFGIVPAWRVSRADIYSGVRGAASSSRPTHRFRDGLVVTQVAMALVLLVGAGLLLRSFRQMSAAELGFDPDGVLTMTLSLPGTRYADGPERVAYYHTLLHRLKRVPGVVAVGASNSLPLAGADGDSDFRIEGQPPTDPTDPNVAWIRRVTEDYFEAVDLRLVRGRGIERGDDAEAPRVVVVNETLARRYYDYPGRDPVGAGVTFGSGENPTWRTIVGVVRDTRHFAIRDGTRPAMYFPYQQVPSPRMSMVMQGVISHGVSRRMREMGIRVALGAEGADVRRTVLKSGLALTGLGAGLGVVGALGLTRILDALLFDVPATDPVTFVAMAGVLTGVALLASWLPARRAASEDPVSILREE